MAFVRPNYSYYVKSYRMRDDNSGIDVTVELGFGVTTEIDLLFTNKYLDPKPMTDSHRDKLIKFLDQSLSYSGGAVFLDSIKYEGGYSVTRLWYIRNSRRTSSISRYLTYGLNTNLVTSSSYDGSAELPAEINTESFRILNIDELTNTYMEVNIDLGFSAKVFKKFGFTDATGAVRVLSPNEMSELQQYLDWAEIMYINITEKNPLYMEVNLVLEDEWGIFSAPSLSMMFGYRKLRS